MGAPSVNSNRRTVVFELYFGTCRAHTVLNRQYASGSVKRDVLTFDNGYGGTGSNEKANPTDTYFVVSDIRQCG